MVMKRKLFTLDDETLQGLALVAKQQAKGAKPNASETLRALVHKELRALGVSASAPEQKERKSPPVR